MGGNTVGDCKSSEFATTNAVTRMFWLLRAPVVAAVIGAIALTWPSQIWEVYRALGEGDKPGQLAFAIAAALFAFAAIWWTGRYITILYCADELKAPGAQGILLRWLPRICAAALLLSTSAGLYMASDYWPFPKLQGWLLARSNTLRELEHLSSLSYEISHRLVVAAKIVFGFAAACLFLGAKKPRSNWSALENRLWPGALFTISLLAWILVSFAVILTPVAQIIGTLGAIYLFVALLSVFLAGLTIVQRAYRLPFGSILLLWILFLAAFDINDNHAVPMTKLPVPKRLWDAAGPQIPFKSWLDSRSDLKFFQDKNIPYPVFIVAARGGGIYAAAQTALTLTRLQDRCPNFAQHIFAISGVSGGSIGAALFSSLVSTSVENQSWKPCLELLKSGNLEQHAGQLVRTDFLAPVVAAQLFPGFLQLIWPFAVPSFDSARELERAIERAWRRVNPKLANPFENSFLDQWNACHAAPALLLNTSEVESGKRRVISPFSIVPTRQKEESWFYDPPGESLFLSESHGHADRAKILSDMRLSTAAVLSARFPWILPAATLKQDKANIHLVDGGYFDNSGIETALDLIEVLSTQRGSIEDKDFAIYLILLQGQERELSSKNSFTQALSPIRALLSTRIARGNLTDIRVRTMRFFYGAGTRDGPPLAFDIVSPGMLDQSDFDLELSFQLSTHAHKVIATQISSPHECGTMYHVDDPDDDSSVGEAVKRVRMINHSNSCQQCLVTNLLGGKKGRELYDCRRPAN